MNQVQSKEVVQLEAIIHKLSIRRNELNFELLGPQEHRALLCSRLEDNLYLLLLKRQRIICNMLVAGRSEQDFYFVATVKTDVLRRL